MGIFKKLIDLFVALFKLGLVYVLYVSDYLYVKYFYPLVKRNIISAKKPREAQSKNGVSEYISLKEVKLSEKDESRWRQEFMTREYDFSEYDNPKN